MPERVVSVVERWAPRVILFCAVGTCVCVVGLIWLGVQVVGQISQGQKARETQCMTFPVAKKLYAGAAKYRIITRADLRTYLASAPRDCPPKR